MAEYIDRQSVIDAIMSQRLYYKYGDPNTQQGAYNMIKRLSLLDAIKSIPVPSHGRLTDADVLRDRLEKAMKMKPSLEGAFYAAISFYCNKFNFELDRGDRCEHQDQIMLKAKRLEKQRKVDRENKRLLGEQKS